MSSPLDVSAAERWQYQWVDRGDEEQMHIRPVGDLIEHELTEECACGPQVEHLAEREWAYVHHSLDGRELLEGG